MKFKEGSFWKNPKKDERSFIECAAVIRENDSCLIILGRWLTQGVENYWFSTYRGWEFVQISKKELENWEPYRPDGRLL
jgi:hypothetical protein